MTGEGSPGWGEGVEKGGEADGRFLRADSATSPSSLRTSVSLHWGVCSGSLVSDMSEGEAVGPLLLSRLCGMSVLPGAGCTSLCLCSFPMAISWVA